MSSAKPETLKAAIEEAQQCATVVPKVNPVEAAQAVLDRMVAEYHYINSEIDRLSLDELWRERFGSKIPNEWIRLAHDTRRDIIWTANQMVKNGIADRAVAVKEAQVALVVGAIRDAAVEIGLDNAQLAALGAAIRDRLSSGKLDDLSPPKTTKAKRTKTTKRATKAKAKAKA